MDQEQIQTRGLKDSTDVISIVKWDKESPSDNSKIRKNGAKLYDTKER